jgi:hypothetical protein
MVTIGKPPLGLGVGKVEILGVAAQIHPNEGTRWEGTTW